MTHEIADTIKKLQQQKDEVILRKFKEKGYGDLLKDADKRRFKGVVIEKMGNLERFYVDNGTDEGELIVTFEENLTQEICDEGSVSFSIEIKYY